MAREARRAGLTRIRARGGVTRNSYLCGAGNRVSGERWGARLSLWRYEAPPAPRSLRQTRISESRIAVSVPGPDVMSEVIRAADSAMRISNPSQRSESGMIDASDLCQRSESAIRMNDPSQRSESESAMIRVSDPVQR